MASSSPTLGVDFFHRQDVARRNTLWLVVLFAIAVLLIVAAVNVVVGVFFVLGSESDLPHAAPRLTDHPEAFLLATLITLGVIGGASFLKTAQLAAGGESVAAMLGGRRIQPQTKDPAERRLLNVVEEMAIASGTPVPPVYVLDGERSINAFAAGFQPGDAVIGVSRGCLDYLTRDELQGVMAHEFSHVLNGDMRLNLRLVGVLYGILVLALVGYYLLRSAFFAGGSRRRGGRGAAGMALFGLSLMAIGGIGLLFGRLIKSAVSRQREYLADAAAVQFTRYPEGIAGALKKIGGLRIGARIDDPHAGEVSHMFFGNAIGSLGVNLFSTHPPLAERIRRLDPSFDGRFPKTQPLPERRPPRPEKPTRRPPAAAVPPIPGVPRGAGAPLLPGAHALPGLEQILYAAAILESLPRPVYEAVHEPYGARAAVYALLLDEDQAIRGEQLAVLEARAEELSYRETLRLAPLVDALPRDARIPLADMALAALKELSPQQYQRFHENVDALVEADGKMDLFEFTLCKMILGPLDVHFGRRRPVSVQYYGLQKLYDRLAVVVGALAYAGHQDEEEAARAYRLAFQQLDREEPMPEREACSLAAVNEALEKLAQTAPRLKQRILDACTVCVLADRQVTIRERELLRAIAAVLEVPMPPVAPEGTPA